MNSDPSKDQSGDTNHRSTSAAINELHRRLAPGTRPAMHPGLLDVISSDLKQPPTVLPASFDAVVSHIRSLM
jgi:hypothetical protein